MSSSAIDLAGLLRLAEQLHGDRDLPLQARRERDRAIGRECLAAEAHARLVYWLDRVRPGSAAGAAVRWLGPIVGGAGLVSGAATMAALLLHDPAAATNVITFFALFVGLQLLLTALAWGMALAALAGRRLQPPGNVFAALVQRALPHGTGPRELAEVLRWRALQLGQEFGLWFNAGALLVFFTLLAVTDRTFTWSSTLQVSDAAMARAVNCVSAPWAQDVPAATLDEATVAASRSRALSEDFSALQVASMRSWWPFLAMAILVYGVLPRLPLWGLAAWRYRRALLAAFVDYPGARQVLRHMDLPLVSSRGDLPVAPLDGGPVAAGPVPADAERAAVLVDWAGALAHAELSQVTAASGLEPAAALPAGSGEDLDRALRQRLNRMGAGEVYIAVKCREAPLAELGDFIAGIDRAIACVLLLVPLSGDSVTAQQQRDWQAFARQLPGRHVDLLAAGPPP